MFMLYFVLCFLKLKVVLILKFVFVGAFFFYEE